MTRFRYYCMACGKRKSGPGAPCTNKTRCPGSPATLWWSKDLQPPWNLPVDHPYPRSRKNPQPVSQG
mgnify:CR=1 FL=1